MCRNSLSSLKWGLPPSSHRLLSKDAHLPQNDSLGALGHWSWQNPHFLLHGIPLAPWWNQSGPRPRIQMSQVTQLAGITATSPESLSSALETRDKLLFTNICLGYVPAVLRALEPDF